MRLPRDAERERERETFGSPYLIARRLSRGEMIPRAWTHAHQLLHSSITRSDREDLNNGTCDNLKVSDAVEARGSVSRVHTMEKLCKFCSLKKYTTPILKPKIKSIKLYETCLPLPSFYTLDLCEVSRVNYARRCEQGSKERCSSHTAACTAVGIGVCRAFSHGDAFALLCSHSHYAACPFPELR